MFCYQPSGYVLVDQWVRSNLPQPSFSRVRRAAKKKNNGVKNSYPKSAAQDGTKGFQWNVTYSVTFYSGYTNKQKDSATEIIEKACDDGSIIAFSTKRNGISNIVKNELTRLDLQGTREIEIGGKTMVICQYAIQLNNAKENKGNYHKPKKQQDAKMAQIEIIANGNEEKITATNYQWALIESMKLGHTIKLVALSSEIALLILRNKTICNSCNSILSWNFFFSRVSILIKGIPIGLFSVPPRPPPTAKVFERSFLKNFRLA